MGGIQGLTAGRAGTACGALRASLSGKAKVISQQVSNIAADPLSENSKPPHWYSSPDSKVPPKRPRPLAA